MRLQWPKFRFLIFWIALSFINAQDMLSMVYQCYSTVELTAFLFQPFLYSKNVLNYICWITNCANNLMIDMIWSYLFNDLLVINILLWDLDWYYLLYSIFLKIFDVIFVIIDLTSTEKPIHGSCRINKQTNKHVLYRNRVCSFNLHLGY